MSSHATGHQAPVLADGSDPGSTLPSPWDMLADAEQPSRAPRYLKLVLAATVAGAALLGWQYRGVAIGIAGNDAAIGQLNADYQVTSQRLDATIAQLHSALDVAQRLTVDTEEVMASAGEPEDIIVRNLAANQLRGELDTLRREVMLARATITAPRPQPQYDAMAAIPPLLPGAEYLSAIPDSAVTQEGGVAVMRGHFDIPGLPELRALPMVDLENFQEDDEAVMGAAPPPATRAPREEAAPPTARGGRSAATCGYACNMPPVIAPPPVVRFVQPALNATPEPVAPLVVRPARVPPARGSSLRRREIRPWVSPDAGGLVQQEIDPNYRERAYSVRDVVESFNPLQHLPVVGQLYRRSTGTQLHPIARIVGGGLTGPIGAASAFANVALETATGRDLGGHVLHALGAAPGPPQLAGGSWVWDPRPADDAATPASDVAMAAARPLPPLGFDPVVRAEFAQVLGLIER